MTPETKRKAKQAARTRKSRKNKNFVAPLEKLCTMRWLCYVDDTPAAVRKTLICVDPNPDHLPEEEPGKAWTAHDVTLSKLYFNFSGDDFRARCCYIELTDILTRAGAQRFVDNNGFPAEVSNEQLLATCANLVPIYPAEQVVVPRMEGVREEAFVGATCSCWNQHAFPYLYTLIKRSGQKHGMDTCRMRSRSVKLTNVNTVCASRHRVVREAFKVLLSRHIGLNLLCHTSNMECLGFEDNEPSLWNTLNNMRYNQSFTCPPLQFVKSSYSKIITRAAFSIHSTLLMDDAAVMGPGHSTAQAAVWEPYTWEATFDDCKGRLLALHALQTNRHFRNELLRESNIMASGLVCKGSQDHTGDRCVWLRPRSRGANQIALQVTLLKSGGRLAQTPRDHFAHDEEVHMEVFSTEAQTTGLDIYGFMEKNCIYQTGCMKVRKTPGTPGTRGIEMTQVKAELPEVPWKRTPRK